MMYSVTKFFIFNTLLHFIQCNVVSAKDEGKVSSFQNSSLRIHQLSRKALVPDVDNITVEQFTAKRKIQENDSNTDSISTSSPKSNIMNVRFSVQLQENSDIILKDGKDESGFADDKLSEALLQTTTQFLCEDTTFFIVSKIHQTRDICLSFKRAIEEEEANGGNRNLQFSRTKLRVDPLNAIADAKRVVSTTNPKLEWLQVGVEYEVLETSDQVILLSEQSVGRLTPLEIIERTAELVTGQRIDEGDFEISLQEEDERVRRVAMIGTEDIIFGARNNEYIVKPMHGTRIAGIVMMSFLFVFTTLLFSAASARNKEAVWEKERMQEGPGGLATIQGVDAMLAVGRMKAKNGPINNFQPEPMPTTAEID